MFYVCEKKNPLAIHGQFDSIERAQRWIDVLAPQYTAKGYFMDKTLTPDAFEVRPCE